MVSIKIQGYKPHPPIYEASQKVSCQPELSANILDSDHMVTLSWQNAITVK